MTKHFSVLALVLIGCGGAIEDHGVATSDYTSPSTTDVDSTNTVVDSTTSEDSTTSDKSISSGKGTSSVDTAPTSSGLTDSRPVPSTSFDVTSNGTEVPSETTDTSTSTDEEGSTSDTEETTSTDEEESSTSDEETTTSEPVTTDTSSTSDTEETTSTDEETTSDVDTTETSTSDEETTTSEPVMVCVPNTACADDGNPCTNDICSADGMTCNHPAKSNGTACGNPANSLCDNADSCQAGTCASNPKPAGTPCDTDNNVCTQNVCNGAGTCSVTAAPANTVCDVASCDDDTAVSAATCSGQTSCPLEREVTECYGTCNDQGTACAVPGITEIYSTSTSALNLQQLSSNTTDLFFLENGGIRKMSKNTRTVSSIAYTKDAGMAHLFLYPSDTHMVTLEANADWSSQEIFCSPLNGGTKTHVTTIEAGEVVVTAIGSINWIVVTGSNHTSELSKLDCAGITSFTTVYTTSPYERVVGKPAVTASSVYLVVRSSQGHPNGYKQKVVMVSKNDGIELGHAVDLGWVPTAWGIENGEVVYLNGSVWYRSPAHIFSFPADVALNEGILTEVLNTESLDLSFLSNQWHGDHIYGMGFTRTNIFTGEVESWTEFDFQHGLVFSGNTAYFHSDCWTASQTCNQAIYSMSM